MKSVAAEQVKLEPGWSAALSNELRQPYMADLRKFLVSEARSGKVVYPRGADIFNALNTTPLERVKVVILGQDPYHGPGQAHGLSFSVKPGVRPPPSLKNIFKEIKSDLNISPPTHGDLTAWARQGVLLLNVVLTVEQGKAASHRGRGWERFTDAVIRILSERNDPIIFLLWGAFAQSKESMVRRPPHRVFKAPHPSPLSAHSGFFGCGHFSKTNEALKEWNKEPVDWSLTTE